MRLPVQLVHSFEDAQRDFEQIQTEIGPRALPAPSGNPDTDVANINAALINGGTLVAKSGTYLLNALVTLPNNTSLLGQGSTGDNPGKVGLTTFRCTTAGAGLMFDGSGGETGRFAVDGNNVGNLPMQIGASAATAGTNRLFSDIRVYNAVQDNWTVLYLQNSVFVNCAAATAGRDDLHFDGGCGTLTFVGWNAEGYGRYGIYSSGTIDGSPQGLFQVPSGMIFTGGGTEGIGTTSTAALWIDNGFGFTFDTHFFEHDSTTAGVVVVNTLVPGTRLHSTNHVFRNLSIDAGNGTSAAMSVDGSSGVMLDGGGWFTSGGIKIATGGTCDVTQPPGNFTVPTAHTTTNSQLQHVVGS